MGLPALIFHLVWWLLVFGQNAAGSPSFDVVPSSISPGLTDSLTANCSFSFGGVPNVATILSMIISKAKENNGQSQSFEELVSLTAFASNRVTKTSNHNAATDGHVSTHEDSFLSLHWSDPSDAESGLYRCDVNVLDDIGRPKLISTTAQVTSNHPGLDDVIDKLNQLQSLVQSQENKESELEKLVESQNNTIVTLQSQSDYQSAVISSLLFADYELSDAYNGRFYLMSKQDFTNISHSEAICEEYGGYLTELDDSNEHDFVKNFLNPFTGEYRVILGATNQEQIGVWKLIHGGGQMVYTDWYTGEASRYYNNRLWNCMMLFRPYQWQMLRWPCSYNRSHEKFLCEIPFK